MIKDSNMSIQIRTFDSKISESGSLFFFESKKLMFLATSIAPITYSSGYITSNSSEHGNLLYYEIHNKKVLVKEIDQSIGTKSAYFEINKEK